MKFLKPVMTTFNDAFLERLRDDAVVQEEKM
jgi:hypothetical protein